MEGRNKRRGRGEKYLIMNLLVLFELLANLRQVINRNIQNLVMDLFKTHLASPVT